LVFLIVSHCPFTASSTGRLLAALASAGLDSGALDLGVSHAAPAKWLVASAPPPLSKVLAEQVVMAHLFGGGTTGSEAVAAVPQAAPSNIGVRGIYAAADGHSGFAALVLDGNPVSAVVGQEFAPGMVLQRVYPDYVEICAAASWRRCAWRQRRWYRAL
jgi:hypothetical protein